MENKCRWHTGVLEADYESDIWMEHEGEFHGLIDTEKKTEGHFLKDSSGVVAAGEETAGAARRALMEHSRLLLQADTNADRLSRP